MIIQFLAGRKTWHVKIYYICLLRCKGLYKAMLYFLLFMTLPWIKHLHIRIGKTADTTAKKVQGDIMYVIVTAHVGTSLEDHIMTFSYKLVIIATSPHLNELQATLVHEVMVILQLYTVWWSISLIYGSASIGEFWYAYGQQIKPCPGLFLFNFDIEIFWTACSGTRTTLHFSVLNSM